MTFTNKKRIKTELFIDRKVALYKVDGRVKGKHREGVENN